MTDVTPTIDPQRSILLAMDYQPAILASLGDADGLLDRVGGAIDVARAAGVRIGYVRVALNDDDHKNVPAANKMFAPLAAGQYLHDDAPETAIHQRVAPQEGDIIVRKTRVSAFSTTDLDEQLRGHGITTIILAGVSTGGVILSTVRDGADRDYQIFVLADGSADPSPAVHDFLINDVLPMQAHIINTADLPGLITKA